MIDQKMERRRIHRMVQAWAVVGAVIVIASLTAAMAYAQPDARAAGTCSLVGKYRALGPTYADSLSVSGTTCATGVNLIKGYNSCRLRAGGRKGHCHSKVLGFSCSEKRSSSGVQFIGTVHCAKGRAVVNFAYTENT